MMFFKLLTLLTEFDWTIITEISMGIDSSSTHNKSSNHTLRTQHITDSIKGNSMFTLKSINN